MVNRAYPRDIRMAARRIHLRRYLQRRAIPIGQGADRPHSRAADIRAAAIVRHIGQIGGELIPNLNPRCIVGPIVLDRNGKDYLVAHVGGVVIHRLGDLKINPRNIGNSNTHHSRILCVRCAIVPIPPETGIPAPVGIRGKAQIAQIGGRNRIARRHRRSAELERAIGR